MGVCFHAAELPGSLIVNRAQALHLLRILGEDPADGDEDEGPFGHGWQGAIHPEMTLRRLAGIKRQLGMGSVREFTAPCLNASNLLRTVRGLEKVAGIAASSGQELRFDEE